MQELQKRTRGLAGAHPNAAASAQRMLTTFRDHLMSLPTIRELGVDGEDVITLVRCQHLSSDYWNNWEFNNSPRLVEAKPHARRVAAALKQLSALVDEGDAFANDAIQSLSASINKSTAERLDILDAWLDACERIVAIHAKSGPARRDHVDSSIGRLAMLWTELTGKKFPKSIKTAKNSIKKYDSMLRLLPMGSDLNSGTNLQFVSDGPQFAFLMLRAIDPKIELKTVRTALQKDDWRASSELDQNHG